MTGYFKSKIATNAEAEPLFLVIQLLNFFIILSKQQTANSKQQTANSKQQTANSKQQTANSKQQTANSKQQTANSKQQTANIYNNFIGDAMPETSELVLNLWAICDINTKSIFAIAGKVYLLNGTDEDKLNILRKLSCYDHQTVTPIGLPKHFKLTTPSGEVKVGMTSIAVFYEQSSMLFEELFIQLENKLPKIVDFTQTQPRYIDQNIPSNPLCITTLVCEDVAGNRRAIITDEDRAWLERMA